jgi:hypothetical protein
VNMRAHVQFRQPAAITLNCCVMMHAPPPLLQRASDGLRPCSPAPQLLPCRPLQPLCRHRPHLPAARCPGRCTCGRHPLMQTGAAGCTAAAGLFTPTSTARGGVPFLPAAPQKRALRLALLKVGCHQVPSRGGRCRCFLLLGAGCCCTCSRGTPCGCDSALQATACACCCFHRHATLRSFKAAGAASSTRHLGAHDAANRAGEGAHRCCGGQRARTRRSCRRRPRAPPPSCAGTCSSAW